MERESQGDGMLWEHSEEWEEGHPYEYGFDLTAIQAEIEEVDEYAAWPGYGEDLITDPKQFKKW